jgi:DNA mismatch repair protein MutS2
MLQAGNSLLSTRDIRYWKKTCAHQALQLFQCRLRSMMSGMRWSSREQTAGGKTVVLKTTGLLALMAMSGLSVPAKSAHLPFYASVLADIGDQQSLAANLSTFTSHLANIARMIKYCEAPALVLLDEVGTGTDPEEGSALGVAVVDHFRRDCEAHVIATTHYSGLKMYAGNEPGVINASVEFDEKTLQPTYRLIVGVAGASSGT